MDKSVVAARRAGGRGDSTDVMAHGSRARLTWGVAMLAVAGFYSPVLAQMAHVWRTDTYAGHGMFVPLFSAVLVWMDRDRLRVVPARGHPAGFAVILCGLALLLLGRWAESLLVQGVSIVVAVAGSVLWRFGARYLRAVAFPVGFLLFMVPLPRLVVDAVTLDLQLFAAGFAGAVLGLLDIPFYLSGVLIELPTITLQVAEVCNGLRFLMALVVLTTAFAQVSQRSLGRKLLLVASAVPTAILANAVRVAAIVAAAYYVGPEASSGLIHYSIGKAVWALTLVPLVALGLLLRRGDGHRDAQRESLVALAERKEEVTPAR